MYRFKKIPKLNEFTKEGLLIIGLIAFGGLIIIGAAVAIILTIL